MNDGIYVLDTDILSVLQQQPERFKEHLQSIPPEQLAITIITAEEQLRGWLNKIRRAKDSDSLVRAYAKLRNTLSFFCEINILPFDTSAAVKFVDLKSQKIRIGTQDLRIAAIALSVGGVLVTRNLRDFSQVPGLIIEDWTRGESD